MFSLLLFAGLATALPRPQTQEKSKAQQFDYTTAYDVQGHRGGRGDTVENTLPAFAWGLIDGVTTLEMDVGITKDGVPIVWHDENIAANKCLDTTPVQEGDPMFPYVGKYVANLTLAQLKTLDCGSERLATFPLALTYPHTRLATLEEMFAFVTCATPEKILFNIESKINPLNTNQTRSPSDFVSLMLPVFQKSKRVPQITLQSFDWRSLILAKKQMPELVISALADDTTLWQDVKATSGMSPWLGGVNLDDFQGSPQVRLVQAAKSISADIVSPSATSSTSNSTSPSLPGYKEFTTKEMVDTAHSLNMSVKPWTVNDLERAEQLWDYGVDGIITDYPHVVRTWVKYSQKGQVAPLGDEDRILQCLEKFM